MSELVTVAVATFNSAKFVIETLESIYQQTYPDIELIVSDDCSADNTVQLVKDWVNDPVKRIRFKRASVLSVSENTGVSANCNRCVQHATGRWIKLIAGDDILLPDCVRDNMDFIYETPDARVVFSQVRTYKETFEDTNFYRKIPEGFPTNLMAPAFTASDQYALLLISDRINYSPTYFFNKKTVLDAGGYDETDRLVEDYPMWLKLTSGGTRLHYFHKETVGYRMHGNALNNVSGSVLFKPSALNGHLVRKKYVHPHLSRSLVLTENFAYQVNRRFQAFGWNRDTGFLRGLHRLLTVYLNPFQYLHFFDRRVLKKSNYN